jgi:two-component system response regulator
MAHNRKILLVEDDDDDAELTMLAFAAAGLADRTVRTRDGADALDWLFSRGPYEGRDPDELPVLALVDLEMPRIDGLQLLAAIRAEPTTRNLPVVIMTSSEDVRHRAKAYEHHVNSFVQKPSDPQRFREAARLVGDYWSELNLPL